jgi:hypothetical protein
MRKSVSRRVLLLCCVAMVGAACGTSSDQPSKTVVARAPLPAGPTPSPISKMVCSAEAEKELASTLGVYAVIGRPTWINHVYSCHYTYPSGSFTLSVKELSDWSETYSYFDTLSEVLGKTNKVTALGQGAFATRNGSIVVRKDWKVLLVDVSGLPPQFGKPATSSADVAYTIADVIMGCWSGD